MLINSSLAGPVYIRDDDSYSLCGSRNITGCASYQLRFHVVINYVSSDFVFLFLYYERTLNIISTQVIMN